MQAKKRLEYLRTQLRAECISYDELHELQTLAPFIDKDDVELLEPAGVPERIFIIDSVSEVWRNILDRAMQVGLSKTNCSVLRSHFWIKTRKQANGLDKTSYQSKRFTSLVIVVKTLSQWSN